MRLVFLSHHAQAQAGAIEKTAHIVQIGCAHRGIEGIHLPPHDQRQVTLVGADFPAVFVQLGDGHAGSPLCGRQALQVLREFPDEIAAWNPHRQCKDLVRLRIRKGQGDPKQMGILVDHLHSVVNGLCVGL